MGYSDIIVMKSEVYCRPWNVLRMPLSWWTPTLRTPFPCPQLRSGFCLLSAWEIRIDLLTRKGNAWSHQVWIRSGRPDLGAGTHSEMQQAGGGYLSNYQPRSEVLFAGQGTSGIVCWGFKGICT